MIDADVLHKILPKYLEDDIVALEEGYKTRPFHLDCLFNEVQGSINAAFYDGVITKEEADFLRSTHLRWDDLYAD